MKKEIERKFLISNVPKEILVSASRKRIHQGYIVIAGKIEVRIRLIGSEYFLTIKVGKGLIREEIEITIDSKQFKSLWAHTETRRIIKNRYSVALKNYIVEIDKYLDKNKGLIVAEIEFRSERSSNSFTPPSWFGKEITGVEEFRNQNLAK